MRDQSDGRSTISRFVHTPSTASSIDRAASAWRRSKVRITSGLGRRSAAARCTASSDRAPWWQPISAARPKHVASTAMT